MGNYLTIGAKFKPYSFEELIRPYMMYGQAYKELEAGLEDLSNKSSIWEGLTNQSTDPLTHAAYEKYANDVLAQANSLGKNGLNATNRQLLLLLKLRYGKEIVPIELAYALRKQLIDLDTKLRQLAMMSGSALYSDRPDLLNISLDEIIKNPNITPQYETQASRIANSAKMALTLAKQENNKSKWETTAGGQLIERKTSTGLTQLELIDAANGKSSARVEALINQAMEALPSNKWGNVDKNQQRSDIIQGLYAGIGDTKNEIQHNGNFISAESNRDYNLRVEQFKWQQGKDKEQLAIARIKAEGAGGNKNTQNYSGVDTGWKNNNLDVVNALEKPMLGFKKTDKGFINDSILKINKSVQNVDNNIKNMEERIKKANTGEQGNRNPANYLLTALTAMKKERLDLVKLRDSDASLITSIYNKYKHLGGDFENTVNQGYALEKAKSLETAVVIPLNLQGGDQSVLEGISNFSKQLGDKTGIYKLNSQGEPEGSELSRKQADKLFNKNSDGLYNTVIGMNRDKGLVLTNGEDRYTATGITPIRKVSNHISSVSKYLSGYESKDIDSKKVLLVTNKDFEKAISDPENIKKYGTRIDNYSYGVVVKEVNPDGSFDYAKIVYDMSDPSLVRTYTSSLDDETTQAGRVRGTSLNNLSTQLLSETSSLFLGVPKKKGTE